MKIIKFEYDIYNRSNDEDKKDANSIEKTDDKNKTDQETSNESKNI